jgi:hypothetical protein
MALDDKRNTGAASAGQGLHSLDRYDVVNRHLAIVPVTDVWIGTEYGHWSGRRNRPCLYE